MTNNIRVFLWLGLGLALWINYSQWQMDYGLQATPATTSTGTADAPKPPSIDDTVPQAAQPTGTSPTPAAADAPPVAPSATPAESVESGAKVRVTTDVLVMDIDLKGGTLVYAELPGYPMIKGQTQPVVLFNQADAATNYVLQTGLAGPMPDDPRPTHLATFTSAADKYELAAGQDELRVPLTWSDGQGVTVTKTFVFHRSLFVIGLEQSVQNGSASSWKAASYARISRTDPEVERSMFKVESFAYRGPAIFDPNGDKYQRLDITKSENQNRSFTVQSGWLAGMQHHFTSVIVPNPEQQYSYTLRVEGRRYYLGAAGPSIDVAPGATTVFKDQLFVGPKLQKQLVNMNDELDHVADYGVLTFLARPLFK